MNTQSYKSLATINTWEPVAEEFLKWLDNRDALLAPGLAPEPTIKVLIFLALLDAEKACSYNEIRDIFNKKKVIRGNVPDNTLRTSVSNLSKTLDKFQHEFELKSFRGRFQLSKRTQTVANEASESSKKNTILIIDEPVLQPENIAKIFVEKSMLPFNALYFLEWSARCWENYSRHEVEARIKYEIESWDHLGIKQRLLGTENSKTSTLILISLGPSEGLSEIELIKKILKCHSNVRIHYLAIDSSPRLLRNHYGLLSEACAYEIENDRLLVAGVLADIFTNLREAIKKVKQGFLNLGTINAEEDFLPNNASVLITYFGNCLGNEGNNTQDPETGFFSMIHSIFQNRPLEILVGVSVMRFEQDEYKRNWDDFLLQTPKHLLEISKLFSSSREENSTEVSEFTLNKKNHKERCPDVIAEPYLARHQIEGQIYRFYYKLAFDLRLCESLDEIRQLPKGTLILLYNIIKYKIESLVSGIEKIGLFKVRHDPNYHLIVNTSNGIREYAVFSAYSGK